MKGLRVTYRGIIVILALLAGLFGMATGEWTYYDYEPLPAPTIEEIQP